MSLQPGDRVVVLNAGTDYARAVKVQPVQVGDRVTVIELSDGTKLPLPRLKIDISDYVWLLPVWDDTFDINGPYTYEMLPLGLCSFTITGRECTGVYDSEREWGEADLTNMLLIPLTGAYARHPYRIMAYKDHKYTIIRETDQNGLSLDFTEGTPYTAYGAPAPTISGSMKIQIDGTNSAFQKKSGLLFSGLPDIWWARKMRITWRGMLNMPSWNGGTSGRLVLTGVKTILWEQEVGDTGVIAVFYSPDYPNYSETDYIIAPDNPQVSTLDIYLQTTGSDPDAFLEIASIAFLTDECPGLDFSIGDKYVIYDPVNKKLIANDAAKTALAAANWRAVVTPGEEITLAAVEYAWDGAGYVYLTSSKTTFAQIAYHTQIRIAATAAGETKVIDWHTGAAYSYDGLTISSEMTHITSILRAGKNTITVSVRDVSSAKIGFAAPVYIRRNMAALH